MANNLNTIDNNLVKFLYGTKADLEKAKAKVGDILFLKTTDGNLDIAVCVGEGQYEYVSNEALSILVNKAILKDGTVAMEDNLDLDGNKIINLADGVDETDAVTMQQLNAVSATVDNLVANKDKYVEKAGDTMTGDLTMASNKYVILPNAPTSDTQAANKKYVDDTVKSVSDVIDELGEVMSFLGATYTTPTSEEVAIVLEDNKTESKTATAGDVIIVIEKPQGSNEDSSPDAGKEYVYTGSTWVKIGDEKGLASLSTTVSDIVKGVYDLKWQTF